MTTLLVMAGGTGGHVYPALAVAQHLRDQGVKIVWLGTQAGIEAKAVPQAGFDIEWVTVRGLRGKGLVRWLQLPFVLVKAMAQTSKVISSTQPDALLGMGGFVSGPGGLMAWIRRRPLVLHEQNAICGLTNRFLAPLAATVLTGFPRSGLATKRAQWVGNPVRSTITNLPAPLLRRKQRLHQMQSDKSQAVINILVLGGSQGARSLNMTVPVVICALSDKYSDVRFNIHHQCGRGNERAVMSTYQLENSEIKVSAFVDDMAAAYGEADLIICRAGAMTVAEVAAAGLAAVFVPYPYAVSDHQTSNAQVLVDAGAASLVQVGGDFEVRLRDVLEPLLHNIDKLLDMSIKARTVSRPKATEDVATACMAVMHA